MSSYVLDILLMKFPEIFLAYKVEARHHKFNNHLHNGTNFIFLLLISIMSS
jgi:hypothetical protein